MNNEPVSISPDEIVYFRWGPIDIDATLVFTWVVMALLIGFSWLVTRKLSTGREISRAQNLLEIIVSGVRNQIREVSQDDPDKYLAFIGTLFIFIAVSNILMIVPGFHAPTGSLTTTGALALCVFLAVPVYGISELGVKEYFLNYVRPSVVTLPFNIIGEFSRIFALAVRLFGNVMSSSLIAAILLGLVPLFFPVIMNAFGLLIGLIHAYIFAILAMVYIASGARTRKPQQNENE